MENNIIFIGACYPEDILNNLIAEKKIDDIAANVFGWKIVKGLNCNSVGIGVINEHKLPPYRECKVFRKKRNLFKYDNIEWTDYSYINFPCLKMLTKCFSIFKELLKRNERTAVVYSIHTAYLLPVVVWSILKKREIVLIVPDLPMFMGGKNTLSRKLLKKIDSLIHSILLKRVKKYILLSKYMKEKLPFVRDNNYIVLEGISDDVFDTYDNIQKEDFILYSGALSERYGLKTLIEGFLAADISGRLVLCGAGDYVEEIKKIQEIDSRIDYIGIVERNKVQKLQAQARLLVNPRSGQDKYTRYSFPSKTMEYLVSGTPILMERLPGIPEEYYEYILEVESGKWSEAIKKAWKMPNEKKEKIGKAAQRFVFTYKTPRYQGAVIKNFIFKEGFNAK